MKKYLTSVSAFQFYHLMRYLALVLTGIVFTKTSLTRAEIGQWETFQLISGAVTFFWLNGLLRTMLLKCEGADNGKSTSPAVFTSFVIITVLSFLSAGFIFLFRPFLSGILLNGNAIPFADLLIVFIIMGIPSNMIEYLYLMEKKNGSIVWYGALSFFFQLVLVLIPAIAGAGIRAAATGLVLSMLIRYVWLMIILFRRYPIRFSARFAGEFLCLGWPLVVSTFLGGSAQYVDAFIITSRFSQDAFAVFQYGARELPLAVLLANALSNSMLPEFSAKERLAEALTRLKDNSRRLMHFLFPVTIILLLLSHPVFPLLFNPGFKESATIFNIYLLLIISRLVFPQTILTGLQHTREIMVASLLELAVNVIFSLSLVSWIGIRGVAWGTVIAFLFEKIFLAAMLKKKLGIGARNYVPVNLLLLYSVLVAAVFIFAEIL